MATDTWGTPESIGTALSTALDALGNGSYSAASSAITNGSGTVYKYMALELYLASLTPSGTPYIEVYLLPTVDATNYVDGGGATAPPAETLLAVFSLSTSASTKRRAVSNLLIPPFDFKLVLKNASGVSLAASGSTLKYRRYSGSVA